MERLSGREFQPVHDRLDVLSREWRSYPILPDAIRRFKDIIDNPQKYSYIVEDRVGDKIGGELEDPFEISFMVASYDLSSLQNTASQSQKDNFFFTAAFDMKPLRDILGWQPMSDPTPFLCIERVPQDVDGILEQAGKGIIVANALTDGIGEGEDMLRNVTQNVFVDAFRNENFHVVPKNTPTGVELELDDERRRYDKGRAERIPLVRGMLRKLADLTPSSFKEIEMNDIVLRKGVLFEKPKQ